jgi:hypothetical protein
MSNPQSNPQHNPQDLADRYAAVWNATDRQARESAIAELWAPDGAHYVRTLEVRGYDALEKRIVGSYERNVRDLGNRFRAARNAQALHNAVTFNWEMVAPDGSKVLAVGLEFLLLDDRGRIIADYQFIVA